MKKIMLLLLIAVVLSSCSRVISKDYEEISSGLVTQVDEEQCEITMQSLVDRQESCWKVFQTKDGFSWRLFRGYTEDILVGDTVFVYKNQDGVFVSKLSTAEAQCVNQTLSNYCWHSLLQVPQLCCLIVLMFMTVALYYISKENGLKNSCTMAVFNLVMAICIFLPGKTLQRTMIGFVSESEDKVVIDNAFRYKVANEKVSENVWKDAFSDETIKCEDLVYVYEYVFLGKTETYFVSKRKLDGHTLTSPQVYPEIMLRMCLIELVLLLLVWACVFPFRKKFSLLDF